MKHQINNFRITCIGLVVAFITLSCNNEKKPEQRNGVADYEVLTVSSKDIEIFREFPVTIEGTENIEIYPKIEGFIEKVHVDEGEYVKKGQLLFSLNAPEYQQDLLSTKAAISSAKADVSSAQVDVEKAKPLVEREIISKFELTSAENSLTAANAALEQAQANYSNALTSYNYTKITAPVSGYIGSLPYKLGSLVSSSISEPLTTVSNIKQVYAYFSINEKTYLEFAKAGLLKSLDEVSLLLPDYTAFDQKGKIQTVSGQVDEETGSFNVRAIFDNPDNLLRTGNSATIQIPRTIEAAFLIPQSATYEIQGGIYVYLVNEQSQVQSTKITVTATNSGQAYIVTEGLKEGDQVVLEGISGLSSGKVIKPVPVKESAIKALQQITEKVTTTN
ncbi:efflux RND transporter periplasmic adaptor subunit [Neotamlana laminarinivorans]|uniref:Efflux RND transporter periplasmic adaptor subunit n=1 Tax=Neotamlana laminarinivorans TaxID=2883124 RepID=A0A9X1L628_9FLAO|nr:efflux RND transporter periplasmic adaptor subunit [Tamlana laminarinivorans]MCB4800051.1 efflux RND transporter periplasmic adaptor subunit [Tamlana laminarinivorans]